MTRRCGILTLAALLSAAPLRAQTSWGVAATTNNEIVFCDAQRDTVWKLNTAGALSVLLPDTHCRAAVLGVDGFVYGESVTGASSIAANSGGARDSTMGIWRYGSGSVGWIQAPTSRPDPSLWVVVDRLGRAYSWNGALPRTTLSQIIKREITGSSAAVAGGRWGRLDGVGDGALFGRVGGLALAPDNTLLIADSGNLRRMTPAGEVTTESVGTISDPDRGLVGQIGLWDRTLGLAADSDGSALVVDYPRNRIVRITRDGRLRLIWQSTWGWRPTGVAALQSGYYVMEERPMPAMAADLIGTPRILLVMSDGTSRRIVSVASWLMRGLALLSLVILASALRGRRRRPQV